MRKLCLAIPSLQPGGMERVMSELANYFSKREELEIHLILYGLTREVFYPVADHVYIHKPKFNFNNSYRLWNTIHTLQWLRKTIKSIDPASILSFGEYWNNFVLLSLVGLNYPVFVSDRCQPNKSLGLFHDTLRNWLYHEATGVICQTQKAKEIFLGMFSNQNMHIIGNPIRSINPNPEIQKQNIILSVGRLIKSKQHDELIRIFANLKVEDWKLVIVVDDALKQKNKEQLQLLIDNLGLTDKVKLAGKRSNVEDYYNQAKIFAFTSSSEGFPNVVGEAMSAGLPVVAYDCVAGPADLIEDGETGFLIPLDDQEDFKSRLNALILSEKLRKTMGAKGRIRIQQFNVESIGNQFQKVLLGARSSN